MSCTLEDLIDQKAVELCHERGVYLQAAREAVASEIRRRIVSHFSYDLWQPSSASQSLTEIIKRYE